ncbi:MAG: endolytic transglycosylase MltG [Anaerolineae bacterium]
MADEGRGAGDDRPGDGGADAAAVRQDRDAGAPPDASAVGTPSLAATPRPRRSRRWPLLAVVLLIASGGAWLVAGRTMMGIAAQIYFAVETRRGLALAPSDDPTPVTFVVDEGDTLSAVARRLEDDGLIRSARLLLVYHKCIAGYGCNFDGGPNRFIQAGAHELRRTMTMQQVYDVLLVAESTDVTVTLPEGCAPRRSPTCCPAPASWTVRTS